MTSTIETSYDGPAVAGEATERDARELLGQVMGLVAVAVGFAALGAYLGRDLSGGTGLLLFIPAFACILGLHFAAAKRPRATGDRPLVRDGSPARPRGRPSHRRLRRRRPVCSVAGGRRHRGIRRRPRRVRLCHAQRPLVVGTHAVLGAVGPDRVRDRRALRLDSDATSSTPSQDSGSSARSRSTTSTGCAEQVTTAPS